MQHIGQMDKFKAFFDGLLKKKTVTISKALGDFLPSRKLKFVQKGFKYPGGRRLILYVENGGNNIVLDDYSLWEVVGTFKSNAASWSRNEKVDGHREIQRTEVPCPAPCTVQQR